MLLNDTGTPGTDDWCLMQLAKEFGSGLPRLGELQSFVDGTALLPVQGVAQSQREAYLRFVKRAGLTLGDTAVKARVSRRKVLGFRTAAAGDLLGDTAAMANWNRSKMKVGSKDLFTDEATFGAAYLVMSGPVRASADARPQMIRISPWNAIATPSAVQPWLTEYGATFGYDPIEQVDMMTLYRPGYIRTAVRAAKGHSRIPTNGGKWAPGRGWEWTTDVPVYLGYTGDNAMVQLSTSDGLGVFEPHINTLTRIYQGILERLIIVAMQSFRQRALSGKLPKVWPDDHPNAGEVIDYDALYASGPAALWMLPPDAEVWESAVTGTQDIISGSKFDVAMFAAGTGTPLYTLLPDMSNVAAGAADLSREGIVSAVEDQNERDEVPLALAQGLNFQALGDAVRADSDQIEVIWKNPARISITEQASAASQAKAGGLPQRMIDERIWQMSPAEISQARQDRTDEAFESAVPAATGA
jgi:hypothetical protein